MPEEFDFGENVASAIESTLDDGDDLSPDNHDLDTVHYGDTNDYETPEPTEPEQPQQVEQSQQPTQEAAQQPTTEQPQQPTAQEPQLAEGLTRLANGMIVNKTHDVVDEQGNIIAKAGVMRRMHQEKVNSTRQIEELTRDLNRMKEVQSDGQQFMQQAANVGLDKNDLGEAMRLAGMVKSGKVAEAAKELVAMAMAQGHNATDILGSEVGDSVDMRALNRLVEDKLRPITDKASREQAEIEAAERGQRLYNEFVQTHPNADIHQAAIASLMKQRGLNPTQAYYEIRDFASRNGLDFRQPLLQQIEQRRQSQQQQQPQVQTNQPPVPTGRANSPAASTQQQQRPAANVSSSYSDIIRNVLEDNPI
jgi:hypothetical protein